MALGITQEQLAEATNLSRNHISDLERGVKVPQVDTLIAIANALHITADMILLDYIEHSYPLQASVLSEKLAILPPAEQHYILSAVDAMVQASSSKAR